MEKVRARALSCIDLFNLKLDGLKGRRCRDGDGRAGAHVQKVDEFDVLHRSGKRPLYMQGMKYANGEFIQIHPTAIPAGQDAAHVRIDPGRRGADLGLGRLVEADYAFPGKTMRPCGKTGEPWYFLEEMYPAFGNLVPRDIGSREVTAGLRGWGLALTEKCRCILDVTHLPQEKQHKLESVLEIYQKFTGDDPQKKADEDFPGRPLFDGRSVGRLACGRRPRPADSVPADDELP